MATKTTTAAAGYAIRYDLATRSLSFLSQHGGKDLMYLGVPPEVFYGMPTGQNVQNFIDLSLIHI
jgi:hypothetical protein